MHTYTDIYTYTTHKDIQTHTRTRTSAFSHQVFLLKVSSVFSSKVQICANTLHVQTQMHLHLCILCADACVCKCPLRLEVNTRSCFLGTAHLILGGGVSHYDLELRSQLG